NLRKEFFRVTLKELKDEIIKLEPGKDFSGEMIWKETERARAQQFFESQDIDSDAQKVEKWLQASRRRIERRERMKVLVDSPVSDISTTIDDQKDALPTQGMPTSESAS